MKYAAVLELIHTATLVHDDIIDGADTRRGRVSVNRRWGNELTVLFGDYLYMKGMKVALEEGDVRVLDLLADVTLAMTEGEILGAERRGSVDLTIGDYLEVVRRKTALLFAAACRIPAFLVPGAEERAETPLGASASPSGPPSSSRTTSSTTPRPRKTSASRSSPTCAKGS